MEQHRRPEGRTDGEVGAAGKVSEALEWVERARGHLYSFHQLMGRADFLFGDAAASLREAGAEGLARLVEDEVVGRNVVPGRWTFEVVEEFDEGYYDPVRAVEARVRATLMGGRRHILEAELKTARQRPGPVPTTADS